MSYFFLTQLFPTFLRRQLILCSESYNWLLIFQQEQLCYWKVGVVNEGFDKYDDGPTIEASIL